jgi:hypothetical protein
MKKCENHPYHAAHFSCATMFLAQSPQWSSNFRLFSIIFEIKKIAQSDYGTPKPKKKFVVLGKSHP